MTGQPTPQKQGFIIRPYFFGGCLRGGLVDYTSKISPNSKGKSSSKPPSFGFHMSFRGIVHHKTIGFSHFHQGQHLHRISHPLWRLLLPVAYGGHHFTGDPWGTGLLVGWATRTCKWLGSKPQFLINMKLDVFSSDPQVTEKILKSKDDFPIYKPWSSAIWKVESPQELGTYILTMVIKSHLQGLGPDPPSTGHLGDSSSKVGLQPISARI